MRGAFDFESNRWNHAAAPSLGNETTPREGLWIAPLPTPKRVPLRTQLILAAFFGASLLATYLSHGFLFPVVLLSALVSLILLSSPGDKPNFVPTEEDLKLLEDEGDLDVCLITLKITADGREVGRDRGAAWFSDGRFLFNGHRTSFALGGQAVGVKAGEAYVDVGTLHGYREAIHELERRSGEAVLGA